MNDILDEIVAAKRIEVEEAKGLVPLDALKDAGTSAGARRPFEALFERDGGTVLIAEIKPKSPSAGVLIKNSPSDITQLYGVSAADVISVLTDEKYFSGNLQLLKDVRGRVPQAILRKDFIIDEYQLYESRAAGADVVLLIAAILPGEDLKRLLTCARSLGLDTFVEVHDASELEQALDAGASVIGINNRNLKTLDIDLGTTDRLAPQVPPGVFAISESGIYSAEDVKRVRTAGVRGILVGTSILRSSDPVAKIAELKRALK